MKTLCERSHFWLQGLLFLPALLQFSIFFIGRDIYPFSNNEMYAGHPDPQNFSVVYLVGVEKEREFYSLSKFMEETLTPLIDRKLASQDPDFVDVCALIGKDLKKNILVKTVRIEERFWKKVSKETVTRPDVVRVLHECQYP